MNIDKKLDELIENNKSNSFDFYEFEELRDSLKDYVLVPINKIHSIHSRNLEDTITRLELKNELEEMMGFES